MVMLEARTESQSRTNAVLVQHQYFLCWVIGPDKMSEACLVSRHDGPEGCCLRGGAFGRSASDSSCAPETSSPPINIPPFRWGHHIPVRDPLSHSPANYLDPCSLWRTAEEAFVMIAISTSLPPLHFSLIPQDHNTRATQCQR
jgi:hypothetical protein